MADFWLDTLVDFLVGFRFETLKPATVEHTSYVILDTIGAIVGGAAEPEMQALAARVGESCSAAVLDGADIVYVLRVPTHKIMSISLGVGSRLPAHCTSLGRMLLAGLSDEEALSLLQASDRPALTRHTVSEPDELLARVRQARKQGWCLVNQELEEGLISLAAPLTDRSGRTVAALNISGQANRTPAKMMQETMLPALLEAAATISRLLAAKQAAQV